MEKTNKDSIRVLVIGDTVGKPGRRACRELIPKLRETRKIDLVVVNGENIANGSSLTPETVQELFAATVDVITTGDHVFKKKEAIPILEENPVVLRPLNYPKGTPGRGSTIISTKSNVKVGVINLLGRVFIQALDCPFRAAEEAIKAMKKEASIILVDFHAEATSEKMAMGWFLDGLVSAVYGTHTHVQTSDERILPSGTAYITELGMTGPYHSVIGRDIEQVLYRFRTQMPGPMDVATEDVRLSGALIEIDTRTSRAKSIERIHEKLDRNVALRA